MKTRTWNFSTRLMNSGDKTRNRNINEFLKGKMMKTYLSVLCICSILSCAAVTAQDIPLSEHPRPDFQRELWQNLNGRWSFQFDKDNKGIDDNWFSDPKFSTWINVPFPWGSKLSGVEDKADIGWYTRTVKVPESWKGNRVFMVIGACDWYTTAWIDGKKLGDHQGGYTPFAFDLTDYIKFGKTQQIVIRADDTPHPFKLEGKQGYGRAAGIWQTVYLEARPEVAIETVHFTPDIDKKEVTVRVTLDQTAPADMRFSLVSSDGKSPTGGSVPVRKIAKGQKSLEYTLPVPNMRLWSLEDPYLYEVMAVLRTGNGIEDRVKTYFGMRKIGTGILPGTDYPYVTLNNKPIYLQLSLDQAYHPEGYYTFPSDKFMRDEILRSKQIGLNAQRIHIKVEIPRKLYWADKLGLLIMADVPNSWGPPEEKMRSETEYALRNMIKRDYNHPAIFSWVNFNETWGLKTGRKGYLPETQKWVESVYRLTKKLDSTRLVEDNSPCNYDHVVTDINTWHAYLPGYEWKNRLDQICRDTHPGSTWNYIGGRKQGSEPMLNSECGNVWGYKGSTGDVDWSWDYHIMMNEFRRHPKVCGWLYTEHHDVINEWNGYWRYDRSEKETGMSDLATGMTLKDLHSEFYIATERELCREVKPGSQIEVPIYASFMTDRQVGKKLTLQMRLFGFNSLGFRKMYWRGTKQIEYTPWMTRELDPVTVRMPSEPAVAVLSYNLLDSTGSILHTNFTTYLVTDGTLPRDETITSRQINARVIRFTPASFKKADWSQKQWNIFDGLKVNGAGAGYFEYEISWPKDLDTGKIAQASLRMELSSKKLFGKDKEGAKEKEGDFMRGKGIHDPSGLPNSYPMTDSSRWPSAVNISVNNASCGTFQLSNDSADHRGILSWHSQKRDNTLSEAGSYGNIVNAVIPGEALESARKNGKLKIRLTVAESLPGGVAVYGERFGRYMMDPSVIFVMK